MICLLRIGTLAATMVAAAAPFAGAWAADLDSPYLTDQPVNVAPVIVDRPVVAQRYVVLPPVGGAFVYVQGLNGPSGPPVYPILPFAFGYGY